MKVIFLDIDGVLNNSRYAKLVNHLYGSNGYGLVYGKRTLKRSSIKWDPYNVGALKTLMNKTGAKIVISSTWRYHNSVNRFKQMFELYGLKPGRIIAHTPEIRSIGSIRGDEINRYLEDNDVDNYVILDDDGDFYGYQNLVQTNPHYGLTDSDMLKAVEILK